MMMSLHSWLPSRKEKQMFFGNCFFFIVLFVRFFFFLTFARRKKRCDGLLDIFWVFFSRPEFRGKRRVITTRYRVNYIFPLSADLSVELKEFILTDDDFGKKNKISIKWGERFVRTKKNVLVLFLF